MTWIILAQHDGNNVIKRYGLDGEIVIPGNEFPELGALDDAVLFKDEIEAASVVELAQNAEQRGYVWRAAEIPEIEPATQPRAVGE